MSPFKHMQLKGIWLLAILNLYWFSLCKSLEEMTHYSPGQPIVLRCNARCNTATHSCMHDYIVYCGASRQPAADEWAEPDYTVHT